MTDDSPTYDPEDRPLERVSAADLTARISESVSTGVFATGVLVLHSPTEVMLDFVQGMVNPRRLAARVVMPASVAEQFIKAIEANLAIYAANFGAAPREPSKATASSEPSSPKLGDASKQPAADAYSQIKVSDEVLAGAYANAVTITHSPSEFCFDFIARGFPRSVVTCRVCMAAPRVPGLRDSLHRSLGTA